MMKLTIYALAFATGMLCGWIFMPSKQMERSENTFHSTEVMNPNRVRHRSYSRRIEQLLQSESSALSRELTFREATEELDSSRRSPLRLRSFMDHRVHLLSKNDLVKALAAREIRTNAELAEAARRLTLEDQYLAFDIYNKRQFGARTMENIYAFSHAMIWTWVQKDPESLMRRLQKMPRGGNQQDSSLTFTGNWASYDPASAVKHFEELVALRNVQIGDTGQMTDAPYAAAIMRSWLKKDADTARAYVRNLPEGAKKSHFQKSLEQYDKKSP